MSDHTTAGWQELSRALGKDAVAAILAEPPDDTFGWGATLEQMWREPAHPSGLLLLGPDGCGKHTAALHMMRILMADGYQYAVLNDEVLGMAGSVAELIDWIGAHMRRGIRLCLVLDQLHDRIGERRLLSFLGAQLARNRRAEGGQYLLFLMVIDSREPELPAQLRGSLLRCVMALPNAEFRRAFLANVLWERFQLELENYAGEELIGATEGFTYAQLRDLAYQIGLMLRLDASEGVEAYITQLAREQAPLPAREEGGALLAERLCELLELLPALLRDMAEEAGARTETLVQGLADAVSRIRISAPAVETTVVRQTQAQDQPLPAQPQMQDAAEFGRRERERIENMPPNELYQELFGELAQNQN